MAPRFPDPAARETAIRDQAANWAAKWDANSLIILRRAFRVEARRHKYVRIDHDAFHAPSASAGRSASATGTGQSAP